MFSEIIIVALFLVNYGYVESGTKPLTIIGGIDTGIGTYKFLVSVQIGEEEVNDCAGSIISPKYVITAAHCVHGHSPNNIDVLVGTTSPVEETAGLLIGISQPIHEHPNYNHTTKVNDISLLRLSNTLDFNASNSTIGALGLPIWENMTYELDTIIMAIGFGESVSDERDVAYTNTLKKAYLKIKDNTPCEALYQITMGSRICANYEDVFLNYHDEGAPVLFRQKLFGIVSFTEENMTQRGYTVLVPVTNYLQFILGTMNRNP